MMKQPSQTLTDRPKPYFATFVMSVAVISMCCLGVWQIQRGMDKQARLQQIEARQSSNVLTLPELMALPGDKRDIPFEAHGSFLAQHYFLLDNRIESGRVGYHILAPAQTKHGLLLVNFGFVPANRYRDSLPQITLPDKPQALLGVSSQPSVNPMVTETASLSQELPLVIQAIDLPLLSRFLDQPLLDVIMLLEPQADSGYVRNWQPVVMSPAKHYAYALQWFGLAIACFIIYCYAIVKRKPMDE